MILDIGEVGQLSTVCVHLSWTMTCCVTHLLIKIYHDCTASTGGRTSRRSTAARRVEVSLGGGHELDVLQGAVRSVVVSVAAGDAGAVAHGHRGGGQLRQALVLAVHRQLVCKAPRVSVTVCSFILMIPACVYGLLSHREMQ